MIKYFPRELYTMECHITPPPPQHKRAPKTSDNSLEYPDYLNGNLHMKTTDVKTEATALGSGPTELSSIIYTLQNTLMLLNIHLFIEDVLDAALTVGRVELHRVHQGPPKTQCLHVNRRSACSRALGRSCYFRFRVWVTSNCLL